MAGKEKKTLKSHNSSTAQRTKGRLAFGNKLLFGGWLRSGNNKQQKAITRRAKVACRAVATHSRALFAFTRFEHALSVCERAGQRF